MEPCDWDKCWQRNYNNSSDQRWKTKSLNPLPMEPYLIPIPQVAHKTHHSPASSKKEGERTETETGGGKEEMLPGPRMSKINDTMFCISMEMDVHLFYMITNQEEKAKMKTKRTFGMVTHCVKEKILFVKGDSENANANSNLIFVGTETALIILEAHPGEPGQEAISKKWSKPIPDLRTIIILGTHVIALSGSRLIELDLTQQLKEVSALTIEFESREEEAWYKTLSPVGIVLGGGQCIYYFGSRIEEKVDVSKLKGAPGQKQRMSKSEALTLVRFQIAGSNKLDKVAGRCFPIDYIFQLGIFTRTKIYQIQHETFLLSLHQEVIMIKKNFDGYIVWDNVSVMSSKSQSKKGQLILAEKTILVYSENAEIYAHEIFYDEEMSKLAMPQIDNFRGNDNDEQILYDALLLFYEDSIIKVLAYIKPSTVVYPTNESNVRKVETDPNKAKDEPANLEFTVICISQSDPLRKLEQLISKGKPNPEIEAFCARFNVAKTDETKCRWNVSEKKLKDISNILMEIPQDKFIQTELDNILKKESHGLEFLSEVESKQISRLQRLLKNKVCEYSEADEAGDNSELLRYIEQIIQWLMESIMFLKKVNYSKNFLSFKEYDFIEIGKLKAASLKEEIKLLSCKKYEKRLKYFLNSFKILVIANYHEVFEFLLLGKNEKEIQEFIKEFRFILPSFEEPSEVFIQQRKYNIFDKKQSKIAPLGKKDRAMSFAVKDIDFEALAVEQVKENEKVKEHEKERDQRCLLWEPMDYSEEIQETMEKFEKDRIAEIQTTLTNEQAREKAVRVIRHILGKFQTKAWFKNAAFKQHSMISKTTHEIHEEFKELRRKGAFKILIKFLYEKIETAPGQEQKTIETDVNNMLENFISDLLVPQSFKRNVDGRVRVYRDVLQRMFERAGRKMLAFDLPRLSEFVVLKEQEYFDFLFKNARQTVLTEVKEIYDSIEVGFFKERFQLFLQSPLLQPSDIIDFLDEFTEEVVADDIRIQVFSTIKRLLRLSDKVNTKRYIQKSMDKEVLPEGENTEIGKLREEAKIPVGFYYYELFRVFGLNYTYQELINFTRTSLIGDARIFAEMVRKYCREEYPLGEDYDGNAVCEIHFEEVGIHEQMQMVDIHKQPLEFFGLLLMLLDELDFQVDGREVFELLLESYLNELKFKELSDFLTKLKEYHMTEQNLRTNSYKMISEFKEEIDLDHHFIEYVLEWIRRNYDAISHAEHLEPKLHANDRALNMLTLFSRHSLDVKKQQSLLQLISTAKLFDPELVVDVEAIKREAEQHTSFIFLIRLFQRIGVDRFADCPAGEEHIAVERFFTMFEAHKEYVSQTKVDYEHPQYLRLLIEVLTALIRSNKFAMAQYLMLTKIPNDKYYFRDALLLFLAAADRPDSTASTFMTDVAKQILMPETTKLIRQNFNDLLHRHRIGGFIALAPPPEATPTPEQEEEEEKSRKPRAEEKTEFFKRCCSMFELIMSKNRKDDAFFFLVRARVVDNDAIAKTATRFLSTRADDFEVRRQREELASHLLVTSYIKALEGFVEPEFYPTFSFFESKMVLLGDARQRKDMVKDINIALSKLDRMKSSAPAQQAKARAELEQYYTDFMRVVGENPQIRLAVEEGGQAGVQVGVYARREQPRNMFEEEDKQEVEYKKELQRNLDRVNQVQADNKLNVLNREVTEKISEIRKANERHIQLEEELKREDKEESLAERKAKEIEQIKKKEREEIESIKDSYKSNTTKRVNELIETLRKKREAIQGKRNAPTSSVRDDPVTTAPVRNKVQFADKPEEPVIPVAMRAKLDKIRDIKEEVRGEGVTRLTDLQKKMFPEPSFELSARSHARKANFEDILGLYREQESPEAVKCIQKYDMLKNPQVRTELVKRAYSVTARLENLIEFLRFLLALGESWKESIEEKSLSIASQMIKMQQGKDKLSLKDIIPAEFFTTVSRVSQKDYYSIAFDMFRPSLKRIFEKELMAVHAVGILFRYTLGSENRYYSKVFYEYFKVLLRGYEIRTADDKEVTLLAEKLRSNYASLPDSKEQVLEELLGSVGNMVKRNRLLQALKKTIERKGETLVGGQSNKEIALVVQKMLK